MALQSPNPIVVFRKALEILGPELKLPGFFSIHDEWRKNFNKILDVCMEVSKDETGYYLADGRGWIDNSQFLSTFPLWRHYKEVLNAFYEKYEGKAGFYFSLPGDPESRAYLVDAILPPATLFRNGCWARNSNLERSLLEKRTPGVLQSSILAQHAQDMNYRFRKARKTVLLQKLGLERSETFGRNRILPSSSIVGRAMSDEYLNFKWGVPLVEEPTFRRELNSSGATLLQKSLSFKPFARDLQLLEDSEFIPRVFVQGSISLSQFSSFTYEFLKNPVHSGLIIDVRGEEVEVFEHSVIERGALVLIGAGHKNIALMQPEDRRYLLGFLTLRVENPKTRHTP